MEYNRAQLKQSVKLSMKGSGCMMVALLFTVAVSAGTWLINTVLGGLTPGDLGLSTMISFHLQAGYELEEAVEQAILKLLSLGPGPLVSVVTVGMVTSILAALWQSTMNVGYEGWCLGMVRHEHPPISKIFCALPQIGPVLVTRFLTGLFELLWSLLVGVGYLVLVVVIAVIGTATEMMGLTIVLLLAAFVGFVLAAIWVTMRYALVDYVLLDKGLSGLDAIRESKRLMKGNIGKGWVLQLSFFGWYLLAALAVYLGIILAVIPMIAAFGLGSTGGGIAASGFAVVVLIAVTVGTAVLGLWLRPYVTGSMARFYDWANGSAERFQGGAAPGSWGNPGDYTWSSGASSGSGTGSSSGGGFAPPPPPPPPSSPKSPRDDPWE